MARESSRIQHVEAEVEKGCQRWDYITPWKAIYTWYLSDIYTAKWKIIYYRSYPLQEPEKSIDL